jgi:hypothetical protein
MEPRIDAITQTFIKAAQEFRLEYRKPPHADNVDCAEAWALPQELTWSFPLFTKGRSRHHDNFHFHPTLSFDNHRPT